MKVELKLYPQGGIDCLSKTCGFRRECANHETAGEYRNEDGFTPDLIEKNGEYFCSTAEQEIFEDYASYRGDFPKNYNSLSRGAVLVKELQTKSAITYQV